MDNSHNPNQPVAFRWRWHNPLSKGSWTYGEAKPGWMAEATQEELDREWDVESLYASPHAAPAEPGSYEFGVAEERNRYLRIIEELIDKGVIDDDSLEPIVPEPHAHFASQAPDQYLLHAEWLEQTDTTKRWYDLPVYASVPAPAQSGAASVTSNAAPSSLSVDNSEPK